MPSKSISLAAEVFNEEGGTAALHPSGESGVAENDDGSLATKRRPTTPHTASPALRAFGKRRPGFAVAGSAPGGLVFPLIMFRAGISTPIQMRYERSRSRPRKTMNPTESGSALKLLKFDR